MDLKTIGIIGAGTMGIGIAEVCATAGLDVVMVDVSEQAVEGGMARLLGSLGRLVSKGRLSDAERAAALSRIHGTILYEDLHRADIVVEAATENFKLKVDILQAVERVTSSDTVLASNTSSISITKLAAALGRPDRFIGMHFFNPVPVMALIEVIRGLRTSDATYTTVETFAKRLHKYPIAVRNSPGFVVNRILCPMINEAFCVLGEGIASSEEIDAGMKTGCNHPIGPLALADLIGLDTMLAVMEVLYAEFAEPKYRPAMLLREMVAAGYLGRKVGRGVYDYGR